MSRTSMETLCPVVADVLVAPREISAYLQQRGWGSRNLSLSCTQGKPDMYTKKGGLLNDLLLFPGVSVGPHSTFSSFNLCGGEVAQNFQSLHSLRLFHSEYYWIMWESLVCICLGFRKVLGLSRGSLSFLRTCLVASGLVNGSILVLS